MQMPWMRQGVARCDLCVMSQMERLSHEAANCRRMGCRRQFVPAISVGEAAVETAAVWRWFIGSGYPSLIGDWRCPARPSIQPCCAMGSFRVWLAISKPLSHAAQITTKLHFTR